MNITEQIKSEIQSRYKNYVGLANSLTKNKENACELVHVTFMQLIDRKNKSSIKNVIKQGNFFVYFFVSMKNQFIYPLSEYNKILGHKKQNDSTNILLDECDSSEAIEEKIEHDDKINRIKEIVNSSTDLNWYQKKIFMMYWFPREMNLEVDKISFREFEKKTRINYVSLQKTVSFVTEYVKSKINENGK